MYLIIINILKTSIFKKLIINIEKNDLVGYMFLDKIFSYKLCCGICTALGAVILFVKREFNNRSLAIFLGLASGVMIAVVVFDMMPSGYYYFPVIKKGLFWFDNGHAVHWL